MAKPIYIKFKHIQELKAIRVSFLNVTKFFVVVVFQARTVFFFFFPFSAGKSLWTKAYRSESFKEVTGRCIFLLLLRSAVNI